MILLALPLALPRIVCDLRWVVAHVRLLGQVRSLNARLRGLRLTEIDVDGEPLFRWVPRGVVPRG